MTLLRAIYLPAALWRKPVAVLLLLACLLLLSGTTAQETAATVDDSQPPPPQTENYAVIVSSSRYWFNYRHAVNALTLYRLLRTKGNFTDDRIVLMLADEYATNPRNPYKNYMTSSSSSVDRSSLKQQQESLLYHEGMEIDYRGEDVTVENLARVLSGRDNGSGLPVIPADAPNVNLFLYLTGHGGDSFFKFQDVEEVLSHDLANLLRQRHFANVLFMADTCQAFTLGEPMQDMTNVIVVGSSLRDESSYAHHSNADMGLAMIERYTYALEQYLTNSGHQNKDVFATTQLHDALVAPYSWESQRAHIGIQQHANNTDAVLRDFMVNNRQQEQQQPPPQTWSPKALWTTTSAVATTSTATTTTETRMTRTPNQPWGSSSYSLPPKRRPTTSNALPKVQDAIPHSATTAYIWWGTMIMACALSLLSLAFSQRRSHSITFTNKVKLD